MNRQRNNPWLDRQLYAIVAALGQLWRVRMGSAMSIGVVAIALALPASLWLLLDNVQRAMGDQLDGVSWTVFMQPQASASAVDELLDTIESEASLALRQLTTAEQALADLRLALALDADLDLGDNPLGGVIELELAAHVSDEQAQALVSRLQAIDGVEQVLADQQWLTRYRQWVALGRTVLLGLGLLLLVAVALVIGNTIRLDIENRREEIAISQLVGATRAFIRAPFLYGGAWLGVFGALVALLVVAIGSAAVAQAANALANSYALDYRWAGLNITSSTALLLIGPTFGIIGAWLAVGRHFTRERFV